VKKDVVETAENKNTKQKISYLDVVESKSTKKQIPYFEIGDTVDVHCKIEEGGKTRVQIFTGTVIARKGRGTSQMFTVRRMVGDEGVERTFPVHSPHIVDVKPVRSGKVRRAKLYYLRKRSGKSVRLSKRHSEHTITS
jgi:large subunit ribosomal protein L19